jgi:hypothetical protein
MKSLLITISLIMLISSSVVFGAGLIDISYAPYKITRPGSYILVSDLTTISNQTAIAISTSNVSIDLNGHTIFGPGINIGTVGMGIVAISSTYTNIKVTNGTVRDFPLIGILLAGPSCQIIGVQAHRNGFSGIFIANNGIISDSIVSDNTAYGIYANTGSKIDGNNAYGNKVGINASNACIITNNVAYDNTSEGISGASGCYVYGNSVYNNDHDGLYAGNGSVVINNSASLNLDNGIRTGSGCTVKDNSAYNNTGNGIKVTSGCEVTDNSCRINSIYGINGYSENRIFGNTCTENGYSASTGAGIYVNNFNNVIENNVCIYNGRGLKITAGSNYFAGNKLSGNILNIDTVASNTAGTGSNINIQFYHNDAPIQLQLAGVVIPFGIREYEVSLEQMLRW